MRKSITSEESNELNEFFAKLENGNGMEMGWVLESIYSNRNWKSGEERKLEAEEISPHIRRAERTHGFEI